MPILYLHICIIYHSVPRRRELSLIANLSLHGIAGTRSRHCVHELSPGTRTRPLCNVDWPLSFTFDNIVLRNANCSWFLIVLGVTKYTYIYTKLPISFILLWYVHIFLCESWVNFGIRPRRMLSMNAYTVGTINIRTFSLCTRDLLKLSVQWFRIWLLLITRFC